MRKGLGKGKGMGYKNLIVKDKVVHSQSAKGIKQPEKVKVFNLSSESGIRESEKFKSNLENKGMDVKTEMSGFDKVKITGTNPQISKDKNPKPYKNEVENNYENYILDSIDTQGYGVEAKTNKEKLKFLRDTFRSEYGFAIKRMGERNAFKEWISGLPSSYNIEFYNDDIIKLAKRMGSLRENVTEREEQKIINNYFDFMTNKTFKAFKRYKVN